MTNAQMYILIGVPMLFNAALIGLAIMYMNARLDAMSREFNQRFAGLEDRFTAINQRFDDMRDLWRSELRRVEEVLDARLKHIEESRR